MHKFEIAAFRIKMDTSMQYFVNLVTLIITKNFILYTGEMEGESDVGLRTMTNRLFRITRPAQIIREDTQRKSQAKIEL